MTAVASPPSLQALPRLGWNSGDSAQGGLHVDDYSQMFMPRKVPQRSNSSSSASSTGSASSASSTSTVSSSGLPINGATLKGEVEKDGWTKPKKPARGLWPSSKSDPVSGISSIANAPSLILPTQSSRPTATSTMSAMHPPSQILSSQNILQAPQQSGSNRIATAQGEIDPPMILSLLPMNGTFDRKHIAVPLFPEVLRIGRQTNAKTQPTPLNGYFDSKVLSRQHAEIWADRNGKIWIRDVKSSNGTFVNGYRLSPENRDSDPHGLREGDVLELGIDIVSEDQKSIVHHKVSAKVEHAGIHTSSSSSVLDLNFGDIDPSSGLIGGPYPQHLQMRGRGGSHGSIAGNGRISGPSSIVGGNMNGYGVQRSMNPWLSPLTIEHVMKKLTGELKQAKQQSQDLLRTDQFVNTLLSTEPGQEPPKPLLDSFHLEPRTKAIVSPRRLDPMSPFSQPPAPPPQHPLPEKPEMARSVAIETSVQPPFKRIDTEKAFATLGTSPTKPDASASQILSLVEALTSAKREIDSQGDRVKQLEDLLRQERKARESAEERARSLFDRSKTPGNPQNWSVVEDTFNPPSEGFASKEQQKPIPPDTDKGGPDIAQQRLNGQPSLSSPQDSKVEDLHPNTVDARDSTAKLQEKLNRIVHEMDEMRLQIQTFKQRAESAEEERDSLADMVERIRKGDGGLDGNTFELTKNTGPHSSSQTGSGELASRAIDRSGHHHHNNTTLGPTSHLNGRSNQSKQDAAALQKAVASVLSHSTYRHDKLVQSAPYASMLGVVLIGVGIMAYLNGWQKAER